MDTHPLAKHIDRGYLCDRAEEAGKRADGGAIFSAALFDSILEKVEEDMGDGQVIPATIFLGLLRKLRRYAAQNSQPVMLSGDELSALASLMGTAVTAPSTDTAPAPDNIIIFPGPPPAPMPIEAEPA